MITRYWNRIRLLQKLILMVILFLIIPVLLIGYYLFSTSLTLAQKEGREMLEKVVYQLNENIEYRIIGYQNILMQLSLDSGITTTLTQHYQSLQEEVFGLQQINSTITRARSYFPMKKIQVYKTNSTLHEDGGVVLNMERVKKASWYGEMAEERPFYWTFNWEENPSRPSIYLNKWLIDYLSSERFGILHVEISNQAFFDQITNPLALKKGGFLVLDAEGRMLANYLDQESGGAISDRPYLQPVYQAAHGWFSAKINGLQSMVVYDTNRLGWKVVTIVSQQELWQKLQLVRRAVVIVCVLFVVLTVSVLTGFGLRTSKRLNSLIRSMRRVRDGDIGLTLKVHGNDELADLEAEFNNMSVRLEQSLRDISDARSRVETEKLNLLQAQINPHFLYNTLALVKSMAMDVNSAEIGDTVDALAKFFRIALNRGVDRLTFREELEHVKAYLAIHESRYPGRLTVEMDIEEQTLACEIVKITLQPIVENALLHAFVQTGGRGRLRLTAHLRQDLLHLTIADNGSGMTPEQLRDLKGNGGGGFGIYNVRERLKRHYGQAFRMVIHSVPEEGTEVQLLIPQRRLLLTAPAGKENRHGDQSVRSG